MMIPAWLRSLLAKSRRHLAPRWTPRYDESLDMPLAVRPLEERCVLNAALPDILGVVPNLSTMGDADTGNQTFSLTVTFREDMNQTVAPAVEFPTLGEDPTAATPVSTLSLDSGNWTDAKTYVASFNVADQNAVMPDIDVRISGAQNVGKDVLAAELFTDVFSIEMENPTADNVVPASETMGATFTLTVSFSEEMDPAYTPQIVVASQLGNPAPTLSLISGRWADGNTKYEATYASDADDVVLSDVDVHVSGAKDLAGNVQPNYTAVDCFNIDAKDPTVASVTPDSSVVADDQALNLTVGFDEKMDRTSTPVVDFFSLGGDPKKTLSFVSGQWQSDTTYVASFVADGLNVTITDVGVRVSGAKDLVGNTQTVHTAADCFDIDTKWPTVLSVTPSLSTIADMHEGGAFTLTVVYDEHMNTTSANSPQIAFEASSGNPTPTLTFVGGSWLVDKTTYVATYTVADKGVDIPAVAARIWGAQDKVGNTQAVTVIGNSFGIDTANPTVAVNQNGGQTDPTDTTPVQFSVVFSEVVTGFDATDINLSGTAPGNLSATVTGSGATYTVTVEGMTGSGTVIATVAADAAVDAVGNKSLPSAAGDNSVQYNVVEVYLDGENLHVVDTASVGRQNQLQLSRVGNVYRITSNQKMISRVPGHVASGVTTLDIHVDQVGTGGQIVLDTSGGNDQLTLDFSNATPIPDAGLTFDGGQGIDGLNLLGDTSATTNVTFSAATDGTIDLGAEGTLSFSGLEPATVPGGLPGSIDITGGLAQDRNLVINLTAQDDHVQLEDVGNAADGRMQIGNATAIPTFVAVVFDAAKTRVLAINTGAGDDTVDFRSVDGSLASAIAVDGQAGSDSVTLSTLLHLGTASQDGNVSVTAEDIYLDADIATNRGGSVNAGFVTLDGSAHVGAGNARVIDTSHATGAGGALTVTGETVLGDGNALLLKSGSGTISLAGIRGTAGGPASDLAIETTSTVAVSGSVGTDIGTLRMLNSGGAMFAAPVTATTVALEGTTATRTIAFKDDFTASTLTTTAQGFGVSFCGDNNRITNPTTFNNTGGVFLGEDDADEFRFDGGVNSTVSTTAVQGTIRTSKSPLRFADTTLNGNTTLDTTGSGVWRAGGDVVLDAVAGNNHALTIDAGSGGAVNLAGTIVGLNGATALRLAGGSLSAHGIAAVGDIEIALTDGAMLNGPLHAAGAGRISLDADSNIDGIGKLVTGANATVTNEGGTSGLDVDIDITASDIELAGIIDATILGRVHIRPSTTTPVLIGTPAVGAFCLSRSEVELVVAETLQLGDAASGPIQIDTPVELTTGLDSVTTLHLITGGSVAEAPHAFVSVDNLGIEAGGDVVLASRDNDVRNLAVATSTGNIAFVDATDVAVATGGVDGVVGLLAPQGSILLVSQAGDVAVGSNVQAASRAEFLLHGDERSLTVDAGIQLLNSPSVAFVTADNIAISSTGLIEADEIVLRSRQGTDTIDLGATTAMADTLDLSATTLGQLKTVSLLIQSPGSGTIRASQPVTVAADLRVETAGGVIVDSTVSARAIDVHAGGTIRLTSNAVLQSTSTGGQVTDAPPHFKIKSADTVFSPTESILVRRHDPTLSVMIGGGGSNHSVQVMWGDGGQANSSGLQANHRPVIPHEFRLSSFLKPSWTIQVRVDNDPSIRLFDHRGDLNSTTVLLKAVVAESEATYVPDIKTAPERTFVTETFVAPHMESGSGPLFLARRPDEPLPPQQTGGGQEMTLYLVEIDTQERVVLPLEEINDLDAFFERMRQEKAPDGRYRLVLDESGQGESVVLEFEKSGDRIGEPVREPQRGSNPRPARQDDQSPREGDVFAEEEAESNEEMAQERMMPDDLSAWSRFDGTLPEVIDTVGVSEADSKKTIMRVLEESSSQPLTKAARLARRIREGI